MNQRLDNLKKLVRFGQGYINYYAHLLLLSLLKLSILSLSISLAFLPTILISYLLMPLPSSDEIEIQIEIYKKRLHLYASDICKISEYTYRLRTGPASSHLIVAKLDAAHSSLNSFEQAWEKLEILYAKKGDLTEFPDQQMLVDRSKILDLIHIAEAARSKFEAQQPSVRDLNSRHSMKVELSQPYQTYLCQPFPTISSLGFIFVTRSTA